jgi:hypothetical protein
LTLAEVQDEVAAHMDNMLWLFMPGVKISVFVRTPNESTLDFVMTSEPDLHELTKMIERRERESKP